MEKERKVEFICIQCLLTEVCGPLLRSLIEREEVGKTIHSFTEYKEQRKSLFILYALILESRKRTDQVEHVFPLWLREKVEQLQHKHYEHLMWIESFKTNDKALFKNIAEILKELSGDLYWKGYSDHEYFLKHIGTVENMYNKVLRGEKTEAFKNYWKVVDCILTKGQDVVDALFRSPRLLLQLKELFYNRETQHHIFQSLDLDDYQYCDGNIRKAVLAANQWVLCCHLAQTVILTCGEEMIQLGDLKPNTFMTKCTLLCRIAAIKDIFEVEEEAACMFLMESYKTYILSPISTTITDEDVQEWQVKMERITHFMSKLCKEESDSNTTSEHDSEVSLPSVQQNQKLQRITFEFPPLALSTYSHIRSKLVSLIRRRKPSATFDINDLVILNSDEDRGKALCLDIFEAEPTFTDIGLTFEELFSRENEDIHTCLIEETDTREVLIRSNSLTLPKVTRCDLSAARSILYETLPLILKDRMISLMTEYVEARGKLDRWIDMLSTNHEKTNECQHMLDPLLRDGIISRYYFGSQSVYILGPQDPVDIRQNIERLGLRCQFVKTESKTKHKQFCRFKPGSRVVNHNMNEGTLGMYAEFETNNLGTKYAMITHDHVAFENENVSLSDYGNVELGRCLWGRQSGDQENPYDVAVIAVQNPDIVGELDSARKKDVALYKDNIFRLKHTVVKKHGSSTGTTKGKVKYISRECVGENQDSDRATELETIVESIVIRGTPKNVDFASEGDSGAIVFRPESCRLLAISSLVGEDTNFKSFETSSTSSDDSRGVEEVDVQAENIGHFKVSETSIQSDVQDEHVKRKQGKFIMTVPLNTAFDRYNENRRINSLKHETHGLSGDESVSSSSRSTNNPKLKTEDGFYLEDA